MIPNKYITKIEEVDQKLYAHYIRSGNKVYIDFSEFRPRWSKHRVQLYTYKKFYKITLTSYFGEEALANASTNTLSLCNYTIENTIIQQLARKYKLHDLTGKIPFLIDRGYIEGDEKGIWYNVINGKITDQTLWFIDSKDREIAKPSKGDIKAEQEYKERNNKNTILNGLLLPTLKSIADKYGLDIMSYCGDHVVTFKSQKDLRDFLFKALNDTFIKELNNAGIYPTVATRAINIDTCTHLFNITRGKLDIKSDN